MLRMLGSVEDELMAAHANHLAAQGELSPASAAMAIPADAALHHCMAVLTRTLGGRLECDVNRKLFDTHAGLTLGVRVHGASHNGLIVSLRIAPGGAASVVAESAEDGQRYFRGKLATADLAAAMEQILSQAFPQS
ncbi:hypothetical protein LJR289_003346 [Pseudoduganella sp. LjRoot289]|uniref:hypothetical protein n=1 Tax=Pseudoduganella sp. LjRoot289 TaxID=3342314 RepID=UPI003ECD9C78